MRTFLVVAFFCGGWVLAEPPRALVDIQAGGRSGEGSTPRERGGHGKLPSDDEEAFAELNLGVEWQPNLYFRFLAQGVARAEESESGGEDYGLVQFFAEANAFWYGVNRVRFRGGLFFPPTSLENTSDLWQSPYTAQLSSLNTWIGEEVRPQGLDVTYSYQMRNQHVFFLAGSAFQGNDTMGASIAWRGFGLGDRLTVYEEVLPLPNLRSLDSGPFAPQRDDGTKPFGDDLDDEWGFSGRLGYDADGRALFQAAYTDNRADRRLHRGEYAWETHFLQLGVQFWLSDHWEVLAEWMDGETGMGFRRGPHVQTAFSSGYFLVSRDSERWRLSLRYDRFETEDLDKKRGLSADENEEEGNSYTAAWTWKWGESWRLMADATYLDANRRAVLRDESLFRLEDGALYSLTLIFRY